MKLMTLEAMADQFLQLYCQKLTTPIARDRMRNVVLLMLQTAEAKGAARGAREVNEARGGQKP